MVDVRFFLRFWLETGPTSGPLWRGDVQEVGRKERLYVRDAATVARIVRKRLEEVSSVTLPLGHLGERER